MGNKNHGEEIIWNNLLRLKISKVDLEKMKPILAKLFVDKLKDAYRHLELAEKVENGEVKTDIDAATYHEWQEQEARDANTLLTVMCALYGEDWKADFNSL